MPQGALRHPLPSRERQWNDKIMKQLHTTLTVLMLTCLLAPGSAIAKTFATVEQAMSALFPQEEIVRETVYLSDAEQAAIEKTAGSKLSSGIVYRYRSASAVGYLDSHRVRTLPETLLIVIGSDGSVHKVKVLAFREPQEYLPNDRWYAQFEDRSLGEPLRLGGDVHGVVGATLSARATTRGVRRALACYEVLVRDGR